MTIKNKLIYTWLCLSLIILILGLFVWQPDNEKHITLLLGILLTNFPSSILSSFIIIPVAILVNNIYVYWFFHWLIFVCLGYVQWFILVPKLISAITSRLKKKG